MREPNRLTKPLGHLGIVHKSGWGTNDEASVWSTTRKDVRETRIGGNHVNICLVYVADFEAEYRFYDDVCFRLFVPWRICHL